MNNLAACREKTDPAMDYLERQRHNYGTIDGAMLFKFRDHEFEITIAEHGFWVTCDGDVEHEWSTHESRNTSIHDICAELRNQVIDKEAEENE